MGRASLLFAILFVVAGCQTPMYSGSQCVVTPGYAADVNSFVWKSDPAVDLVDETGYVSPIAVAGLRNAVQQELQSKGFRRVDAGDDAMEVALTLRTRRELARFESGDPLCETNDCWERIDLGSQVRMDVRTVGFLAADIFHEGQPIWRGWVETYLYPKDRDRAEEVIAKAVPKLFETFPP